MDVINLMMVIRLIAR